MRRLVRRLSSKHPSRDETSVAPNASNGRSSTASDPDNTPMDEPRAAVLGLEDDGLLAKRCLAGDVAAWEQIYAQCHEPLLVSIRFMLGVQGKDANLVDEIAARVWYALVAKDGELLARYNPARGAKLVTFMRALARDELAKHFRGELRRRKREITAFHDRPRPENDLDLSLDSLPEFLATLTPRERGFCNDYLLAEPSGAAAQTHSSANIWQLTHRIHQKLLRFLDLRP